MELDLHVDIPTATSVAVASRSASFVASTFASPSPLSSPLPIPPVTISSCGHKGAKEYQEDAWLHWISTNAVVFVGAVFDGHGGLNGRAAANIARAVTLHFLETHKHECEKWVDERIWTAHLSTLFDRIHLAIRDALFQSADASNTSLSLLLASSAAAPPRFVDEHGVLRFSTGDPVHGGTTGSIAVLIHLPTGQWRVVCANVGDSSVLLYHQDGRHAFLSVDHGPENVDEFHRVRALDPSLYPNKLRCVYDKLNVMRKSDCPRVFLDNGVKDPTYAENPWAHGLHPTNVRYEPAMYAVTSPAVAAKDSMCIAMTRSLGDFYAHQFGLTHVPSITCSTLPRNSRFAIVVGSDGIWDCWKYEDLGAFLQNKLTDHKQAAATTSTTATTISGFKQAELVAQETLQENMRRAVANFGARAFDDASLVLIVVNDD